VSIASALNEKPRAHDDGDARMRLQSSSAGAFCPNLRHTYPVIPSVMNRGAGLMSLNNH
jgi:hypothetical protein